MTQHPSEHEGELRAFDLRRQLRGRFVDVLALFALIALGLLATGVIVTQQKSAFPSWFPILGQDFFHIEGEFTTAQAITPGQGQAVTISGIRVGQVESVRLEDGHAVVGLDVDPEYAPLIHTDARLLMRPKTGLQDMVVELEPGVQDELMEDGGTIPLSRTQPNVNPDEIFARLDDDTRTYLQLLLQAAGEGIGSREQGLQLSAGLRRLEPFSRDIARLNGAIATRRESLARVIHDFRLLTEELANHDAELTRFVDSSGDALGSFARQEASLRSTLRELPGTLDTTRKALGASNRLSIELRPTLKELIPQAQYFAPALRSAQRFFRQTRAPLRDQIRPFIPQAIPTLKETVNAAKPFAKTVRGFRDTLKPLNYGFNELAYNPGGTYRKSYLFYLAWLNHLFNAGYLEDGGGPLRRGLVMLSCNSATLASGFAGTDAFLKTVLQVTRIPSSQEIC
jgi:phospholipid/cholesterol/gamma-HCH transport system substrate-binding protein